MKMRGFVLLLVACTLFAAPWAQAVYNTVPAPPVVIKQWVKYPQTTIFDGNHVTVIELWATWCGDCWRAIPLLTQLQAQYGDAVRLVAVSEESPSVVEAFVAAQGDRMDYPVACGDGRTTSMNYGTGWIPYAVIVKPDGRVYWQGDSSLLAAPLAAAVSSGVFIANDFHGGFVNEGEDITFTLDMVNDNPVNFAWTKNGVSVGGNSPTLTLPHVTNANDGAYVCTVTRVGAPGISQHRGTFLKVIPEGESMPATSPFTVAVLVGTLSLGGACVLMRKSRQA